MKLFFLCPLQSESEQSGASQRTNIVSLLFALLYECTLTAVAAEI